MPPEVLLIESAPHDWLLPQCALNSCTWISLLLCSHFILHHTVSALCRGRCALRTLTIHSGKHALHCGQLICMYVCMQTLPCGVIGASTVSHMY